MVDYVAKALDYFNYLFSAYVTKFIGGLVFLLIGIVLGRVIGKLVKRILHEFEFDNFVRKTTSVRISLEEFIGHLVEYLIYFLSIIYALSKIGLVATVFQLIAAVIIIFVVLSIILGLKDFVPNILAGIRQQQRSYFKVGDAVHVHDHERTIEGTIESMNLLEVVVATKTGDVIYIPNSLLSKSIVRKSKAKKRK